MDRRILGRAEGEKKEGGQKQWDAGVLICCRVVGVTSEGGREGERRGSEGGIREEEGVSE